MSVLPIVTIPDPRLRQKSKPVEHIDDKIKQLSQDMFDSMYANDGGGLAAIQIGVPLRVIVIDISYKFPEILPFTMINPVITSLSEELSNFDEGCLSVPGQYVAIKRPFCLTVEYFDLENKKHTLEAKEILAKVIHHEMDHLEGKLLIDYLSPLKRDRFIRKVKRAKRNS